MKLKLQPGPALSSQGGYVCSLPGSFEPGPEEEKSTTTSLHFRTAQITTTKIQKARQDLIIRKLVSLKGGDNAGARFMAQGLNGIVDTSNTGLEVNQPGTVSETRPQRSARLRRPCG